MFYGVEIKPDPTETHPVTHDELRALARHWIEFLQDENFFWCCYQQYDWNDEQKKIRARMRLNWLRDVLGEDVIRQMQQKSNDKLREQIGQERWRICTSGTEEERLQFVNDNELQSQEFCRKFYNDARADEAFARLAGDPARTYTDRDGDVWFFGARGCTAFDRLNLALRTADGCVGYDGSRSIDRPDDWIAPLTSAATA